MDDVLSLLQRQFSALHAQETVADFLVSIDPVLRAIAAEPRIAVHLSDLRDEALDHIRVVEALDDELVPVCVELRQRLVELWPFVDDSRVPLQGEPLESQFSLAVFDEIAAAAAAPLNYRADEARTPRLLGLLDGNRDTAVSLTPVETESERPLEEQRWLVDFYNLQERWRHGERRLSLTMRVSPGLALMRLERVPVALNPGPRVRTVGEDRRLRLETTLRRAMSTDGHLYKAVHAGLDETDQRIVDKHVAELRAGLDRLKLELLRRIGTTRSRRAIIDRFKIRAEWHDAARLRAVADDETLPGGPEDRLTGELARYLFDAGLSPLTKPMTGGLQPDLLDASLRPAFYVEAKQYADGGRREIVGAVAQVLDTVGRLQGGAYGVTEAFCIIFRRGGARYVLPDTLDAEGYRLVLTVVDIAEADVSGRRQRHKPVAISAQELLAGPSDHEPEARPSAG